MSLRPTVLLGLLALLTCAPAAVADGREVRWRLGRSDMLRYEREKITVAAGEEKRSGASIVTVHGHDLRDAGQYSPASPVKEDLFQLLALRLPAPGQKSTSIKLDWRPRQGVNVRVKGKVTLVEPGERLARVEGTYTFKSRGKSDRKDRWWYDDGRATTSIEFDRKEGVIRTARIDVAYKREDLKKSGPAAVLNDARTYELRLKVIERRRPEDFQARVDEAIAKGLKHLRTLQKDDGTWKPHGGYTLGTTGLAVLTLVACDVPRSDPAITKALDWIFSQEATRTYEQAVCLMAIDRAYTPKAELEALEAGRPIKQHLRDLPPKHMAWVRRTAEALEAGAASPGSWGYPSPSNSLLRFDTSNTQYAVLGLRAASHMGYDVRENTWLGVIRHCKLVQERKGPKGRVSLVRQGEAIPDERYAHQHKLVQVPKVAGFRYSTLESHGHCCSSMTCAGVACLLIARHQLQRMGSKRLNPGVRKEIDGLLAAGWAWLDHHWAMDRHPKHPGGRWYWYFLYSLERACVLDSVKRVGGKDWYFEGAMQLLHRQGETKGDWNGKGADDTPPTCFALLFLKRGTSPLGAPVTGK